MTRLYALFTAICLTLLLAGCNHPAKEAKTPVSTGFSCGIHGTYRGEEIAGTAERDSAGGLTLKLTKPDNLNGLTVRWDGENIEVSMLGISWSVSAGALPQAALGERVLRALDAVTYGTAEGSLTADGEWETTGTVGEGADAAAFTLRSDPQSGALRSLSVPSEELSLTFTDFTML